ncbi:MAG: glycosyltransferase, partial [Acetobacteraceae bacterium]|nr:glycosyltransferase [Acetobacteraceae bacterium]
MPPETVLERLAARPAEAPFAYVATPNADHLIRLARDPSLLRLYEAAALRLLDSRVVARLARLFGLPVPSVVPGSDLTAALFERVIAPDDRLTILGASPGT